MAAIAAAAAVVTVGLGVDPRVTVQRNSTDKSVVSITCAAFSDSWKSFRAVLRVRTFQVLVLQVWPLVATVRVGIHLSCPVLPVCNCGDVSCYLSDHMSRMNPRQAKIAGLVQDGL